MSAGETRQFEIDSYFEYQGKKFAALYDANSYIRVQAAMDEMDLDEQYGDLQSAFGRWRGRTLIVSFYTDWLFPPPESERIASAMRELGTLPAQVPHDLQLFGAHQRVVGHRRIGHRPAVVGVTGGPPLHVQNPVVSGRW